MFERHKLKPEIIGKSVEGRDLYLLTIGSGKNVIWLMTRQHSWESFTSWVGEGFIDNLALVRQLKDANYQGFLAMELAAGGMNILSYLSRRAARSSPVSSTRTEFTAIAAAPFMQVQRARLACWLS